MQVSPLQSQQSLRPHAAVVRNTQPHLRRPCTAAGKVAVSAGVLALMFASGLAADAPRSDPGQAAASRRTDSDPAAPGGSEPSAAASERLVPGEQLATMVRGLVQELGAKDLRTRAAAERRLLELGPVIVGYLPAGRDTPLAPAVKEALRRLRRQLERQEAGISLEPARVRLQGHGTLGQLVGIVEQQTTNPVALAAELARSAAVLAPHEQSATYWETLLGLSRLSGSAIGKARDGRAPLLQLPRLSDDDGIMRPSVGESDGVTADWPVRPLDQQADGVCLWTWRAVDERTVTQGPMRKLLLRSRLECQTEPRLWPLFLDLKLSDVVLAGAGETQLAAWNPLATVDVSFAPESSQVEFEIDALGPETDDIGANDKPGPLRKIRAEARVLFAVHAITTELDAIDLVPGTERQRGGLRLSVERMETTTDSAGQRTAEISILAIYEHGGPQFESHRVGGLFRRVGLRSNADAELRLPDEISASSPRPGWARCDLVFRDLPAAAEEPRLSLEIPSQFATVSTRIDLRAKE